MGESRRCGVLTDAELEKIRRHYRHAVESHPHFADRLPAMCSRSFAAETLDRARKRLRDGEAVGSVSAVAVLDCETAEVMEAHLRGDMAAAAEECYDAIAVLLRMVDVIEGRQTLGMATEAAPEGGAE